MKIFIIIIIVVTGLFIALSERADTLSITLWFVVAVGITVVWSIKTLARQREAYQ